jgi:hypothetical protein
MPIIILKVKMTSCRSRELRRSVGECDKERRSIERNLSLREKCRMGVSVGGVRKAASSAKVVSLS